MACFDDIIALRDNCTGTVPTSGLYIDELNINIPFLNDIVTPNYKNGEDLFNKKLEFAWNLMASQVRSRFSDRYKTSSVVDGYRLGFMQENRTLRAGAAEYRGIDLEICNADTYLDVYLSKVEFFGTYTGDLDILVFDLLQGRQIDTIALTGIVSGEVFSQTINKIYKSERKKLHLYFAYDATGINSYDVTIGEAGCTTCGRSGYTKTTRFTELRSARMDLGDTPINSNLEGLAHTGGLSLIYSLGCNHSDWICEKKNFFDLPILYKTGVEVLAHALTNWDQINSAVLVHRDKIEELKNQYESMYIDQLESVLKKIRLPNDNICFRCNPKTVTRTILP